MTTSFDPWRLRIVPALLLASGPAAASNEGAGLGKGLALLAMIVVGGIALTLIAALVVGGVRAVRRGRSVRRGMLTGLLAGLGGLIGLTLMLYLVFLFPNDLREWGNARADAAITQWLLPLDRMQPGELGATLALLQASVPPYRYASARLANALPEVLSRTQMPAAAEDIDALRAFIATQPRDGVFAESTVRLDGLATWMQWRFAIDDAVQTCDAESDCLERYAQFLFTGCKARFDDCTRDLHIEALSRLIVRLQASASARRDVLPGSALWELRSKLVLANLRPGTVRSQIAVLLEQPPEGYFSGFDDRLVEALAPPLRRMPASLTQDDRDALEQFVAEVRAGERKPLSDPCLHSRYGCGSPHLMYALRGAIVWAFAGAAVAVAVAEFGDVDTIGCAMAYAELLIAHCATHAAECRAAANAADVQRLIDAIGPPENSIKQRIVAGLRRVGEA